MKNSHATAPDPFGMLLVIVRDLTEMKARVLALERMMKHQMAKPGEPYDFSGAFLDAQKSAVAGTVSALKEIYPALPDEFLRKYVGPYN